MSQTDQPTREPDGTSEFVARDEPAWLEPFRRRRRRMQIAAVLGAIVLGAASVIVGLWLVHANEALPGVSVAGIDVGGLGEEDIGERLSGIVEARRTDRVTFTYQDREFAFEPGEAAYSADLEATVHEALRAGREGGFFETLGAHVTSHLGREWNVEFVDTVEDGAVVGWVATTAAGLDRAPFPGRVTVDPESLEVQVEEPRDGVEVQTAELVRLIHESIRRPGPEEMELPARVIPTRVPAEDVRRVAEQAERAVAGPLALDAHGTNVVLSPEEVARLIASRVRDEDGARHLVLHVPVDRTEAVFEPYVSRLESDPRNATFEVVSGLTTFDDQGDTSWSPRPAELRVVPGEPGRSFHAEMAAGELTRILREGLRTADLPLAEEAPEITTEEAENLNVDHLIGTFTTYHSCCQPRVANIQRMADIVRGTVLEPGDVFSVNDTVGRRTRAKGFVADGTIVNGEYVDEVGGGVSQFATTSYNAAYFAGLEIVEWKAHSYYISRYPMGREATLYYPTVDLKFKNNTDNGVFVHTSYTGSSITVSLFGNNGGRTVSADHGSAYNYRGPSTQRRYNPSLCAGCERVVQSGGSGFSVNVVRTIDGDSTTITTVYLPEPRIIEYGPEPSPEPEPEPEPEEQDSDQDDETSGSDGNGGNGGNGDSGGQG